MNRITELRRNHVSIRNARRAAAVREMNLAVTAMFAPVKEYRLLDANGFTVGNFEWDKSAGHFVPVTNPTLEVTPS